jgi:hypothetical protein
MAEAVTLSQLELYLWGAAVHLSGTIGIHTNASHFSRSTSKLAELYYASLHWRGSTTSALSKHQIRIGRSCPKERATKVLVRAI